MPDHFMKIAAFEVKISIPTHLLEKWLVLEEHGTHAPRTHLVAMYDTKEEADEAVRDTSWRFVEQAKHMRDLGYIIRF